MALPLFFALAAVMGAREHILGKRRKKTMLDDEAERQDEINSIDLGIGRMGNFNEFDARQIQVANKQFQTAQGLLRSKDPKMQSLGANMIADLDTFVRNNIQQNETEARTDKVRQQDQEVVAAGIFLAGNEKRRAETIVMNRQLFDELKPFHNALTNYHKVINLMENNDQLSSLAGLTAFVQSIDNSVVREGELVKYKGANGLITEFVNIINKSAGEDFSEATKRSLRTAAAALVNAEKTRASVIANSFQDRAITFGLDPTKVMSGTDQSLFARIEMSPEALAAIQQDADEASSAMQSFAEGPDQFTEETGELIGIDIPFTNKRLSVNPSANIANRLVAPFISVAGGIGRALRGARIFKKDDGTLWIKEQGGEMRRVTNQDFTDLQKAADDIAKLPPDLQRRLDAGELGPQELGFVDRQRERHRQRERQRQ